MNEDEELMLALDQWKKTAELVTGFKRQLIDAGWSEPAAEQMTIVIVLKSGT